MRAGDHVKHKPSGEEWVVAYADGDNVSPCGWPYTLARKEDCVLISAATDDEHRALLRELSRLDDGRGWRARAALGDD